MSYDQDDPDYIPPMPRRLGLMGFTEDDWEALVMLRSTIGGLPELLQQIGDMKRQVDLACVQIDIMSEFMNLNKPEIYEQAKETVLRQRGT